MITLFLAGNLTSNFTDVQNDRILRNVERLAEFSRVIVLSSTQTNHVSGTEQITFCHIKSLTSGALATAAFGLSYLPENHPFLVVPSNAEILGAHIDQFQKEMIRMESKVGAIVFKGDDPQYSYARIGVSDEIIEVVEKSVSGSCALAGVYFFADKSMFYDCIEWAMVNNVHNNGQFYISPALNYFLAKSIRISLYQIPSGDYLRY